MPDGSRGSRYRRRQGVVVAADHPFADRDRGRPVGALGAEFADVAAHLASELVESRAGRRCRGRSSPPGRSRARRPRRPIRRRVVLGPGAAGRLDPAGRHGPCRGRAAAPVVERRERAALGGIALAHDLVSSQRADAVADGAQPTAGQDGRELTGVADRDHLRARPARRAQAVGRWRVSAPCPPRRARSRSARELVAELLEIDQRPVERARGDAGLVGELARRATGRRDARAPRSRRARRPRAARRGVRLAGARERLDDLHTVAARGDRPDDLVLLRVSGRSRPREPRGRSAALRLRMPSPARPAAASISCCSHATRPAVVNSPAAVGQHVAGARGSARAWLRIVSRLRPVPPRRRTAATPRADRTCSCARSARPVRPADRPTTARSTLATRAPRARAHAKDLLDLGAAEPELGRARPHLLEPRMRVDPVALALPRRQRRRLPRRLRAQADTARERRALHLLPPPREPPQRPSRDRRQLGRARCGPRPTPTPASLRPRGAAAPGRGSPPSSPPGRAACREAPCSGHPGRASGSPRRHACAAADRAPGSSGADRPPRPDPPPARRGRRRHRGGPGPPCPQATRPPPEPPPRAPRPTPATPAPARRPPARSPTSAPRTSDRAPRSAAPAPKRAIARPGSRGSMPAISALNSAPETRPSRPSARAPAPTHSPGASPRPV